MFVNCNFFVQLIYFILVIVPLCQFISISFFAKHHLLVFEKKNSYKYISLVLFCINKKFKIYTFLQNTINPGFVGFCKNF